MSLPPMDKSTVRQVDVGDMIETTEGHERVVTILQSDSQPVGSVVMTENSSGQQTMRYRPPYGWTVVGRRGPVAVAVAEPRAFTEDDLRLAFAAGNLLGHEEAMSDEGYGWPADAEHAPTWEQYIETVRALNGR